MQTIQNHIETLASSTDLLFNHVMCFEIIFMEFESMKFEKLNGNYR